MAFLERGVFLQRILRRWRRAIGMDAAASPGAKLSRRHRRHLTPSSIDRSAVPRDPRPSCRLRNQRNETQVNTRILIFPGVRARAGTSRADSAVSCAHCQKPLALLPSSGWDDLLFCSASHRVAYRKARQQDSRVAQFRQWLSGRRPSASGPAA
jgi:hypothetical protein